MSDLELSVNQLEETPKRFRLFAGDSWWGANRQLFRDPESGLLDPFAIDLEGYRLGQRLLFRGDVQGRIELPCGRCVQSYPHAIQEHVELLLAPIPARELKAGEDPEGGIELDPEDLEIGRYAGDALDFSVVLREILLFDWPMQPRCEESCQGLCPSCGVNRNNESCDCVDQEPTKPFAALGELLNQGS